MPKKKKDFPNKFDRYAKIPAERFQPIEYDTFYEWKIQGWELPPDIMCIIRCENTRTNKVKEYVYQQPKAAAKCIAKLTEDPDNVLTICDPDEIHLLSCQPFDIGLIEEEDED